jgi:hypothetical protein
LELIRATIKSWEEERAKARIETLAEDVLIVLRVRGIAVPGAVRERLLSQKDLAQLEGWLEKATVASSIAEVIGDPT